MLTVALTTYEFEQNPEPMWVCIDATRQTMVCGPSPIQSNVQYPFYTEDHAEPMHLSLSI